ncbi:MAG: hypothetical protein PF590_05985 [Candidatus Delongbacteria bacterium]|jgi:hypothetical protein|nr:hypothetical protein [Candidatus Delongbacteria bacterium]
MKKHLYIITVFALLVLLLTGCETYDNDVDYENIDCEEDCVVEKPQYSYLRIDFSEDINDTVWFEIFRGYVDNSELYLTGWATETPLFLYQMPVDNFYAVKATYWQDSTSIIVVDADELKTHFIKNYCDEDCYIITGGDFKVELDDW